MKELKKPLPTIRGSGGGEDEGETRTPVIYPDTLQSIAFLRTLDLICEGEIVGLVEGSKSIYLNGTPLQNLDGSYNYQNVSWTQRKGTQDQSYIPDSSSTEREVAVSARFKFGNPLQGPQPSNTQQSGTAITRTIVDPEITALRVRVSVTALTMTNPTNGDTGWTTVSYSIWLKAADDVSFVRKSLETITGKSSSKYERTRRIEMHGTGPWLLQVRRETADSTTQFTQNDTIFESYTELVDAKLTYPNSALIGIKVDATQFNAVPTRAYLMDLLKIRVPSNYNDVTREYTGTWDGEFQLSTGASSNPAWVFYDILTSDRYGLGKYIPEEMINKWALYEIGRYCDELVDDGFDGFEPRFTCNAFIPGRTEAYNLMKALASVFRGMIHWAGGAITATQDAPSDPVYLYNQSNVIDGKFSYQGASAQTKHSVARVTWNDPEKLYEQSIEYCEDQDAIKELGVIETDIVAFGCTSRGQANRLGRWLLFTEKYETEILTFSSGLEGLACIPGDLIQVADPLRASNQVGGRTKSATTLAITLDRNVSFLAGDKISALLPDGTIEQRTIQFFSAPNVATVTEPFTLAPATQGMWAIRPAAVDPVLYRVIGIQEGNAGSYEVSALRHFPAKYDLVEDGQSLLLDEPPALSGIPAIPTGLYATEDLYAAGTEVFTKLTFGWSRVALAANYQVAYTPAGGNRTLVPLTQFNEVHIPEVTVGTYQLEVVALNSFGQASPPAILTYEVRGKTTPPRDVENFSMIPSHGQALLSWTRSVDLDVLIGGSVRIRWTPRLVDQEWANGIDITPGLTGNSTQHLAPLLAGTYMIKFVDSTGNYSENEKLIVTEVADIYGLNRIETLTEDPDFLGTKTGMYLVEDEAAITLESGSLVDDIIEVDEVTDWDNEGNILPTGEYLFANSIDMGSVWPFQVRVHIDLETYDTGNFIDTREDFCDDWASWDGDIINAMDAQVYMRTADVETPVEEDWTEWKKVINAEYRARHAQFKLVCVNDEPHHNLYIRELRVVIDMVDRTWKSSKLTSLDSGDLHVEFTPGFYAVPSIGVTAVNMNTGDYYQIENEDEDGFDISFYDDSDTRVIRDFYVLAKAYGHKIA